MSDVETLEDLPPVAHATIAYLGPVAPHWELRGHFGEEKMLDDFWARVHARLLLLPKHDPQFRRNRERVNRDAERELIRLEWDLGEEEPPRPPRREPRTPRPVAAAEEAVVEETPVEAPAEDAPTEDAAVEAPADEATAEAPTEEAPVEEAPAEAPVEDASSEDAPAPADEGDAEEA